MTENEEKEDDENDNGVDDDDDDDELPCSSSGKNASFNHVFSSSVSIMTKCPLRIWQSLWR